jgi:hypothetical protein
LTQRDDLFSLPVSDPAPAQFGDLGTNRGDNIYPSELVVW